MTVAEAAAKFPATFGLRGFSGEVFRVSLQSSYLSEGRVVLYTERQTPEGWLDFAKGSPEELRAQVVYPALSPLGPESPDGCPRCGEGPTRPYSVEGLAGYIDSCFACRHHVAADALADQAKVTP